MFWLWVRLPRWSPTGLERGDGWRGVVLLGNESGSLSSAHIKTWLDSRSVLHIAKCSSQKAEYCCTQSVLLWLLSASLYTIFMESACPSFQGCLDSCSSPHPSGTRQLLGTPLNTRPLSPPYVAPKSRVFPVVGR